MDLNAVKVFVKAAETLNFTDTAAALGLTQSGVSRAVGRLESQLNIKLLNRTTRSISLTPDGQAFYQRCSVLLYEFEDAEQLLVARQSNPSGILKISSPLVFGQVVLLPILSEMTKKYPALTIETSFNDRYVDMVEEGFDAAIRIGDIPDSRVVAIKLGELKLKTVASPDYLAKFGKPETPQQLSHHNCLTVRFAQSGRKYDWRFKKDGIETKIPVTGNLLLDSTPGLLELAKTGHGIVQTFAFYANELIKQGSLVPLLEDYETTRGNISIVYPQSRQLSPKVRVLRTMLKQAAIS